MTHDSRHNTSEDGGGAALGHVPVLVDVVLELLSPKAGERAVDGTLGRAGHAVRLLEAVGESGTLLGLDRDPEAIAACGAPLAGFENRVQVVQASFADLGDLPFRESMARHLPADVVLLDLGVSSPQLDSPARGLGFKAVDAPFDLRFDPTRGRTAAELCRDLDETALANLLFEVAQERHSRRIAASVKRAIAERRLDRVGDLVDAVMRALPAKARGKGARGIHPATRTFMALRIAVNDELGALQRFLDALPDVLAPGGRCAILSYHSGEDRLVKNAFRERARGSSDVWELLTKKPIVPTQIEIRTNPRARSAKLRAIRRRSSEPRPRGRVYPDDVDGVATSAC